MSNTQPEKDVTKEKQSVDTSAERLQSVKHDTSKTPSEVALEKANDRWARFREAPAPEAGNTFLPDSNRLPLDSLGSKDHPFENPYKLGTSSTQPAPAPRDSIASSPKWGHFRKATDEERARLLRGHMVMDKADIVSADTEETDEEDDQGDEDETDDQADDGADNEVGQPAEVTSAREAMRCKLCDEPCASARTFWDHMQTDHRSSLHQRITCPVTTCVQTLAPPWTNTRVHLLTQHGGGNDGQTAPPRFNCPYCDKYFTRNWKLNQHISDAHSSSLWGCFDHDCQYVDQPTKATVKRYIVDYHRDRNSQPALGN